MKVDRRFLYWGVFLVAMGAVMVAVDLKVLDPSSVESALWLWPLVIVAVGAAIVLRRTRANAGAWMVAAALPGLALGGAFAVAPRVGVDCASGAAAMTQTEAGSFSGAARVDVTTGCGTLSVGTAAGSGWRFSGGNTANETATISSGPANLSISAGHRNGLSGLTQGRDDWQLTLPTSRIDDLSIDVNAGEGTVNLPGAQLGSIEMTANAGRAALDLTGASVGRLSATLNAGELSVVLPDGQDTTGTFETNAGALKVCVPAGVGVEVHRTGVLSATHFGGLQISGGVWQSPDYGTAAHHANLSVNVNLGSVEINPNGGCK